MLSPDALEEAGEELARVYRGIEAEMLDYLARLMLSGGGVTSRSATAAALLGQTHADELRRIIASHAAEVDAELRATVERHLRASDADDMERIGRPGTEKAWPRQMEATLRGLAAILERDNLDMERGAVEAFLQASTAAIAKANAGVETAERALHAAVRQLERDGVRIVQYVDAGGNATVANRADVAVRRHVRTQIAQDGARMTADAMDRYGVQLVEVSSHPNARPTHASWQGQVYGWRGTVTVDGRTYDGLEAATGYGSVDGLLGANCRHSFGPYLPGAKRAYERDPKHASGLPGEQVYALEQRQRAGERAIREAKRELSGARICHDAAPSPAARAEVVKAQELLARRQDAMRRLVAESNALSVTGRPVLHRHPAREWAGDMAGGVRIASSGRKVDELLAGKAAQAAMARAGVSKTAVKRAIADEMRRQGMEPSDFPTLTAGEQRRMLRNVVLDRKKLLPVEERRKRFKPANPAFLAARKKEIERNGGMISTGEDVTRYLNARDADAANFGEVIMLREDATLSEVLEEEFHFNQHLRGDYAERRQEEMRLLREIDAQKYLLDVAKRYKIPRIETEQTKAALAMYEKELRGLGE
ncbi:phage minor capsid protein [Eggerthella lenta]|uniref:phage minor capsid protein n=1 Tax=Eggerthella lenta TaxID=84112 RepID=UPI001FBA8AED|nr:phage minor capsid protein [Eggerthella lenta]GKG82840.1 hypothetical protein CE91St34_01010 [Eggerthella lenta]GKG85947.1 hypothetical protein CE91St35_01010 [Eggerthella lenta]